MHMFLKSLNNSTKKKLYREIFSSQWLVSPKSRISFKFSIFETLYLGNGHIRHGITPPIYFPQTLCTKWPLILRHFLVIKQQVVSSLVSFLKIGTISLQYQGNNRFIRSVILILVYMNLFK